MEKVRRLSVESTPPPQDTTANDLSVCNGHSISNGPSMSNGVSKFDGPSKSNGPILTTSGLTSNVNINVTSYS